jgi:hypothetical protein
MKRTIFYGILIFIFSMGVGFLFSKMWVNQKMADANLKVVGDEIQYLNSSITNQLSLSNSNFSLTTNSANFSNSLDTISTASTEEKVSPNAEFALKKYYNECGHFKFEYAKLPEELVNLTKEEVEDFYDDWEVEEFSANKIVLVKEISSLCDEHFIIKLGEKYVQIFHLESDGNLVLYKTTDISRDYLPAEDIAKLEQGMYVFGEGKLNSIIEDFE